MNRPLLLATKVAFGAMVGIGTIGLWVAGIADTTRRNEEIAQRGRFDSHGVEVRDA